jgi:hypothetical protein
MEHLNNVKEKVEAVKSMEHQFNQEELEGIHKSFKRVEKSEKEKSKHLKDKIKEMTRKRDEKLMQVQNNHVALKSDAKEKFRYLQEKDS